MSRLPLRLRLTVVFALAMAVVLAGIGAFLYVRLGDSLLEQLDERLAARARALAADLRNGGAGQPLAGDDEEFAQVLDRDGDVVAATPGAETPLLPPARLGAAAGRDAWTESTISPPGEDDAEPVRLLVRPTEQGLIVVGASLEDRGDALDGLLAELLLGGPLALLLASAAGYLLAGETLRPVEAMRSRAAEISALTSSHRLPLPRSRDEVRRLGETLNAMLDRLEAGLRRERRFVADASHELRTPLALLQTELELALRRPRGREELEAVLRSASEEVDRLARLAEDLLLLTSTGEGRLPLCPASFEVRELLHGVARRFAGRAEAAGRTIEVGPAAEGAMEGDRLRLEQALGNLVDNALRHGGGEVRLVAAADNGRIALSVSDGGAGFPAAFIPRAFERFSRADTARTRGGAGLGLAIVDAVARAHGGEARARNRRDGGAEVTIAVPRAIRS
ncbi:MAG TPA: ATP-binding protein [Gaiellaceae bacterium]|nr:ATP-binding protein [Gaiellaceae bacterium]